MASRRPKGRLKAGSQEKNGVPGSKSTALDLADLMASVAGAVARAKLQLDEEAVLVAERYRSHPVLRFLPPPAFAIDEVRLELKFAIAHTETSSTSEAQGVEQSHIYVYVDAGSLEELGPQSVSQIELRITPNITPTASTEENPSTS